jgi:hypothetical protein
MMDLEDVVVEDDAEGDGEEGWGGGGWFCDNGDLLTICY